jgi:hypothetical protein
MKNSITFSIDGVPVSLNQLLNMKTRSYHQYNNYKKDWTERLVLRTKQLKPKSPFTKVKLKLVSHRHLFLDYDNLVGAMKPIVDGLVTAGLFINDKYETTGQWDVDEKKIPKKQQGFVEIEITED